MLRQIERQKLACDRTKFLLRKLLGVTRNTFCVVGNECGSALVELAVVLPILTVFVVGIYDFSAAFNQRQKIAQAAQVGAIVAAAQPTSDITPSGSTNPDSLQPAVAAIFNSLVGSGVIANGTCTAPGTSSGPAAGLTWTYIISSCSAAYPSDNLVIVISRGWTDTSVSPVLVGTSVQVTYPYHWRFGSVIQLLFPGPNGYTGGTPITETSIVHNQT